MPITYPLTPPAAFRAQKASWRKHVNVLQTKSPFTGQRQAQKGQGEWWEFDIELPPLLREDADAINAFLCALYSPAGTFYYGPEAEALPKGVAAGAPTVNGAGQAGNTLLTDGWEPNITNILKAGDWLQIGTHLYKNLTDASSDAGGNATLTVFPRLRTDAIDNTELITSHPKGIFYLTTENGWDIDLNKTFTIKLSACENL